MDIKNGCGGTGGEQEDGANWEAGLTYTLPCAKSIAGGKLLLAQGAQLGAPR